MFRSGPGLIQYRGGRRLTGGAIATRRTPDLQFHFLAGAGVEKAAGTGARATALPAIPISWRRASRGSVTAALQHPPDAPIHHPNSFAEPTISIAPVDGIKTAQEIGAVRPSAALSSGVLPGGEWQEQEGLTGPGTRPCASSYHPVGTCKMGEDEMRSSAGLRVRGMERLRVCDSSIHAAHRVDPTPTRRPIAIARRRGHDQGQR